MLLRILSFALFTISHFSYAQTPYDSLYYYNADGSENWWYVQKDVYTFRCHNGASFSGQCSPSVVSEVQHHETESREMMEIKFSPQSTPFQRVAEVNNIIQSGEVESSALAVTKNISSSNSYFDNEYMRTNDLLIVTFDSPNISNQSIEDFRTRNSLYEVHNPPAGLPIANWSYIMRIDPKKWTNTIDASRVIFANEDSIIYQCVPDQIGVQKQDEPVCDPVLEFQYQDQIGTPDRLWHIRNLGQTIESSLTGVDDADADICECWGEGYHGLGVKIAVIDYGGFDYSHPRLDQRFLTGYDVRDAMNIIPFNDTYWDTTYQQNDQVDPHAMYISSIIAGNENLGGWGPVGVAYESKIIPLLAGGGTGAITLGIQYAVLEGADIINISLGVPDVLNQLTQSVWYPEIENALNTGRGGLGTLVVAAAGNENDNQKMFPGADFNCFGVGATTPNDYRSGYTWSNWPWGGSAGSNYWFPVSSEGNNPRYNVVAPGTAIMASYTSNPFTTPVYNSTSIDGTSAAAPIVCGIAALLLEKNPNLSAQELKGLIQNNTNKVYDGTQYNYNLYSYLPEYNSEVFYGRVSCYYSMINTPLGIEKSENLESKFEVIRISDEEIMISFQSTFDLNETSIELHDSAGKLVMSDKVSPFSYNKTLNVAKLSKGVYFLSVISASLNQRATKKVPI